MPRGGYAPDLQRHRGRAHLRGDAHRPRQHGQLLRRQPLARGEARRHRLPLLAARAARLRRLHPRRPRPGERGPVRLGGRHRRAGRLRRLDRRPHHPLDQAEGRQAHERPERTGTHGSSTVTTCPPCEPDEPIAEPGPARAHLAADRRRRAKAEKRAERQVAALFGLSRSAPCCSSSPTSLDIGDDHDDRHRPRRLQRRARARPSAWPCCSSASGSSSGPASSWPTTRSSRCATRPGPPTRTARPRWPRSTQGAEESGIARRPLVRNSLLGAVAVLAGPGRGPAPRPRPDQRAGDRGRTTSAPASSTPSGTRGIRVVRDVVGTPIRPSDLEIGDLVNAEPETIFAVDEEGEPLLEGVAAAGRQVQGRRRADPDGPRRQQPGRGPRGLGRRRHPLLLQDLHPRRLPDLAQRAQDPAPALPVPPVDVRPRRLGEGDLRPRRPARSPSCR